MNETAMTAAATATASCPHVALPGCPARRRRQSGAAAVEFAFVFPLLFALMYATIVYGLVFFWQQTINMLAQEAAAHVVAVVYAPDKPPSYTSIASDYVTRSGLASVLPVVPTVTAIPETDAACPGGSTSKSVTGTIVCVTVKLDISGDTVLPRPSLGGLMGIDKVPPFPNTLTATASVRVS